MIRATLPTRTLGIGFGYHIKQEETRVSRDNWAYEEKECKRRGIPTPQHIMTMEPIRYTVCQVFVLNLSNKKDVKLLAEGVARCSSLDNFDKEVGRKESLTRAVANLKKHEAVTKEECERVWDAYHGRRTPFDLAAFTETWYKAESEEGAISTPEELLLTFGKELLKKVRVRL